MTSSQLRQEFLDFFRSRKHHIVPSAPMVLKNDPTLMFTNAGMNPFKDFFLGNRKSEYPRIANTQKCLRVSGKHNDLEEVGKDTYHHTMFEMLGNWSFGDYFKEEAIAWAWEFLVDRLGIDPDKLYATVFEGGKEDNLAADDETRKIWRKYLPESHILYGSKKDNFWEMGDTGPCGPCSEIHIDLRDDDERSAISGEKLVNRDNPGVIEIWNLVFIQYNRKESGQLEPLPMKHVDTGMGFERLCRVIQKKGSNYDTDLFQPLIREMEALSNKKYGIDELTDVAIRVVVDHIRAVAFAVADGQLPGNSGAGYVIRRILRRAVRYGFTFLDQKTPFIYKLLPVLVDVMGDTFIELKEQVRIIGEVIHSEEKSFLRTLENGIRLLDQVSADLEKKGGKVIDGKTLFVLYDTYGFPVDLTALIASERGLDIDLAGFHKEMAGQKNRSRNAVKMDSGEWIFLSESGATEFTGYDSLEEEVHITRYRKVLEKKARQYHLVFDKTPFYAEAGGQVGDTGWLISGEEKIRVLNTIRENELIIHVVEKMPGSPDQSYVAQVDAERRKDTARNHSATHLLHHVLRSVLGPHVEQKGSLVHPDYLRFDFSHFQKVTQEELTEIERRVNELVMNNIPLDELREVPLQEARSMGAMSLFGEKYGEKVRVIRFGPSSELCGGTHVRQTGEIGFFVIVSESSVAAGIRRVEALTGRGAATFVREKLQTLASVSALLKSSGDLERQVAAMVDENQKLKKQLEKLAENEQNRMVGEIVKNLHRRGDIKYSAINVEVNNPKQLRDIAFRVKNRESDIFLILGTVVDQKPFLAVMIDDQLVEKKNLDARIIIKDIAPLIEGGGGGQPFFATAGGKNPQGLQQALEKALGWIPEK